MTENEMLIEFTVGNFRSFNKPQTFSMVASEDAKHKETHTFDSGLSEFPRILRSAAVYGANAAGKTNLLRALQFVQSLILNSASLAGSSLQAHSSFVTARSKASFFRVVFVVDVVRYEYTFSIAEGRIEKERLVEYVTQKGRVLFDRLRDSYKFSSYFKGQKETWKDSTRPDALFLSTAVQLNSRHLQPVADWFRKHLVVVVGDTQLNQALTFKLLNSDEGKRKILPFVRAADPGIADFEIQREQIPAGAMLLPGAHMIEHQPGATTANLVRVKFSHTAGGNSADDLFGLNFSDESGGARLLFQSAGAWLNVLENGEVLCVDELDSSLHPVLTRFLVNQFHSKRINPKNAQLIFTTHNTTLLDQKFSRVRRDQVWFVERQRDYSSKLVPLTDFTPRQEEALQKGYLQGRYGALPLIDDIGVE